MRRVTRGSEVVGNPDVTVVEVNEDDGGMNGAGPNGSGRSCAKVSEIVASRRLIVGCCTTSCLVHVSELGSIGSPEVPRLISIVLVRVNNP